MKPILALVLAAGLACPVAANAAELMVGFTVDPLTLDPANHRSRETETVIRDLYDGLLTRDSGMIVQPELASSFIQIDPLTWEFELRDGVKFHDGTTMTADDVKFTFDRLIVENAMGGQTSPRKSLLGPVKAVQVVDAGTVRFVLSDPWPILPAMLPFQEVVSKSFVEKNGDAALATTENGTGPFKLVDWRKGEAVIMERFDDYYGGAAGIPPVGKACVDRVIFRIIPENASRVAALLAGDVDIINELPAHDIGQVEANPDTRVMAVNGTRTFFVAINNTKKPFDDLRVRQAFNHAVDKGLIIDKILAGKATPLNGVLSPDAFAFDAGLKSYAYDPGLARRLLAEAGYPDGIDVVIDTRAEYKDLVEALAAVMAKSGIRAQVMVGEASVLATKWDPKAAKEGDLYFTSWGNGSLDPYDIMNPVLMTAARGNTAGYANAEVDELLEAGETEADPAKRADLYKKAQQIVNADAPWVFLWLPQDIYGVSTRVSNWQPSPDSRINLHDACVTGG
ncbi:MAG: ABC transporter substrate-binding protein [Bauldia sp.]|nr:MAG: ABC transporter substrate-binding protein [Bauldia sp.]MBZ0227738.1 ABC transporter substrate-binding protein [Bauldia sp.]